MHIYSGMQVGAAERDIYRVLTKSHFPTERVALERVIRLLIDDLQVEPLRQDWDRMLTRTEEAFYQKRTWPR